MSQKKNGLPVPSNTVSPNTTNIVIKKNNCRAAGVQTRPNAKRDVICPVRRNNPEPPDTPQHICIRASHAVTKRRQGPKRIGSLGVTVTVMQTTNFGRHDNTTGHLKSLPSRQCCMDARVTWESPNHRLAASTALTHHYKNRPAMPDATVERNPPAHRSRGIIDGFPSHIILRDRRNLHNQVRNRIPNSLVRPHESHGSVFEQHTQASESTVSGGYDSVNLFLSE